MTINGKIKVIDKDISDFSVDRTKKEIGEIKIGWTMTNNLLIEGDPRQIDQGHEIDKSTFYKSYKSTSFSHIHRNRGLSVSKSALYKSLCAKAHIVTSFVEASNKSNIVIL
jgi:hypothetical protein